VVRAEWALARELGIPITIHVAMHSAGRFGMVKQLGDLGLLGPDTTYIHCCYLTDEEWQLVADSGGTVSIAPQIEAQMGHGWPPVLKSMDYGLRPSLSIDVVTTAPGDIFTQIRAAFACDRARVNAAGWEAGAEGDVSDTMLTSRQMLEMATINGAHVAGLEDRTGSLTPGKQADVVVLDATALNVAPVIDPVAAVTNCADVSNVETVLIGGQVRKRDGKLLADVDGGTPAGRGAPRTTCWLSSSASGPHSHGMTGRHLVARAGRGRPAVPGPFAGRSAGFRRWAVVGEAAGAAPHRLRDLRPGTGRPPRRPRPLLRGERVRARGPAGARHRRGLGGPRPRRLRLRPVGVAHGARNPGPEPARWADMLAPQPRARFATTPSSCPPWPAPSRRPSTSATPGPALRPHRPGQHGPRPPDPDQLAVSASMRTALLVYSGITVKMMVDSDLGAQLQTMFMVQYEPGGVAGTHDHRWRRRTWSVEGEVDASFDGDTTGCGRRRRLGRGRLRARLRQPGRPAGRWLETQAPQPPARHSYRFTRDWDYLRDAARLKGSSHAGAGSGRRGRAGPLGWASRWPATTPPGPRGRAVRPRPRAGRGAAAAV
jgi:hypothetical protein